VVISAAATVTVAVVSEALSLGPIFGLPFGFLGGLVSILVGGTETAEAASPSRLLHEDRTFLLAMAASVAIALGTAAAFGLGSAVAVQTATVAGLTVVVSGSAWSTFGAVRLLPALRGRGPLRQMTFLREAHHRGILRQAGGAYQFRHARLRDHLATQPAR
jgi:hypothetical protein